MRALFCHFSRSEQALRQVDAVGKTVRSSATGTALLGNAVSGLSTLNISRLLASWPLRHAWVGSERSAKLKVSSFYPGLARSKKHVSGKTQELRLGVGFGVNAVDVILRQVMCTWMLGFVLVSEQRSSYLAVGAYAHSYFLHRAVRVPGVCHLTFIIIIIIVIIN